MNRQDDIAMGQTESTMPTISRRDLLLGAGALGTLAATGVAFAGDMPGHRHADHAPRHDDLLQKVTACMDKGQRCIAHCLTAFREGDLTLAQCASKAHEMEAVCDAFSYLLAANSTYAQEMAKICLQACTDCEAECRKHEHHIECKACADACKQAIAATRDAFSLS